MHMMATDDFYCVLCMVGGKEEGCSKHLLGSHHTAHINICGTGADKDLILKKKTIKEVI